MGAFSVFGCSSWEECTFYFTTAVCVVDECGGQPQRSWLRDLPVSATPAGGFIVVVLSFTHEFLGWNIGSYACKHILLTPMSLLVNLLLKSPGRHFIALYTKPHPPVLSHQVRRDTLRSRFPSSIAAMEQHLETSALIEPRTLRHVGTGPIRG